MAWDDKMREEYEARKHIAPAAGSSAPACSEVLSAPIEIEFHVYCPKCGMDILLPENDGRQIECPTCGCDFDATPNAPDQATAKAAPDLARSVACPCGKVAGPSGLCDDCFLNREGGSLMQPNARNQGLAPQGETHE